jgi:hypothetical protein
MKKENEIKRFRLSGDFAIFLMSFIFVFLFFTPSFCHSKDDIYIAQSAVGGDTGANCANAHSAVWFNTAGNWNAVVATDGKIGPGDTAHLCGNITTALTVQASGTAGNIITILFEPGASMIVAAWAATGAITVPSKNYITIDGGATGTIGGPTGNAALVNGIIQNTDNGTGLGNQIGSVGVKATGANFFTVKNLAIYNMYVRIAGTEKNGSASGISNQGTPTNITDFTVTNCIIHDAYAGIDSDYRDAGANYVFSYNTIYNCNWGGRTGDRNLTSRMNGLYVHHNKFYDFTNWNETGTNAYHHNGFYGWAETGGQLTNVYVYANEVGPNYGGPYSTSGVYFSGNVSNVYIYNNVFLANAADQPSNGMIYLKQNPGYSGFYVYNNTFIGNGAGTAINGGTGTGTYTIKNNLAVGVTFIIFNGAATSTLVSDYNLGYNLKSGQEYSASATSSSSFKTFSQWQALGYDLHGLNANPLLTENYGLQVGSPAIDAGETIPLFSDDKVGGTRPNGAAWDIGAYEYEHRAPPRNLRIVN